MFDNVSVTAKNYKCFGEDEQGFNHIKPINLIIGRNNSGKSSLLEIIEYVTANSNESRSEFQSLGHKGIPPEFFVSLPLKENGLMHVYQKSTSGGIINGNHWDYGSRLVGSVLQYRLSANGEKTFVNVDVPESFGNADIAYKTDLPRAIEHPFTGIQFKRLRSERDIVPEKENAPPSLKENGDGATNFIQLYINESTLPSKLVEETLLQELNRIYAPDSCFSRILVQRINAANTWEINVEETQKGRIPLSQSGSGFKTVLLVLLFLYFLPHKEAKQINTYFFAFEELENNLHPALQRRLLQYLRDFAQRTGCHFFLTTHSNIIIDLFSRDENAQIIHVKHDGEKAVVRQVQTYIENRGILDDLDVRASDLLQANSIIWVEGPSDRIYINRWIEIWSDGELKEGVHYQCMFYAGRLLAHLSADIPDFEGNAIPILKINGNAIIIIDSDKKQETDSINATKQRVVSEIEKMGGISWVTQGKEIENYIPASAIGSVYEKPVPVQSEQYEEFSEYLEKNIEEGAGTQFERDKPSFAAKITTHLKREDIEGVLDISIRLNEICNKIKEWNRMS